MNMDVSNNIATEIRLLLRMVILFGSFPKRHRQTVKSFSNTVLPPGNLR
jgi:hypothetical protein